MDDALLLYQDGIAKLRAQYARDLEAIELESAAAVNAATMSMQYLYRGIFELPAFKELLDRWIDLDPTTKIGQRHHARVHALFEKFLSDSRQLRKELGLCSLA